MTREQQLTFCKVCTNRKFDSKQGIICGLTRNQADFENYCEHYEEDSYLKGLEERQAKSKELISLTVSRGTRFLNRVLDFFFISAFTLGFGLVAGIIAEITSPGILNGIDEDSTLLDYLISFVMTMTYYIILEGFTGRSLGKLITRTKVVMENGEKLTFDAAVLRSLCRYIPFNALSFLGEDARGWHDTLSKTRVIKAQ